MTNFYIRNYSVIDLYGRKRKAREKLQRKKKIKKSNGREKLKREKKEYKRKERQKGTEKDNKK